MHRERLVTIDHLARVLNCRPDQLRKRLKEKPVGMLVVHKTVLVSTTELRRRFGV